MPIRGYGVLFANLSAVLYGQKLAVQLLCGSAQALLDRVGASRSNTQTKGTSA
jgi:hypothetical protein